MTRRDYVLLAAAFAECKRDIRSKENNSDVLDGCCYAVDYIADALKRENARFDRDMFIQNAS